MEIVSRWEWRTLAESFGKADRRFRDLSPGERHEGDELSLLSPSCEASVKVRDGLMNSKVLESTSMHTALSGGGRS
jgi:hypothetical protein